MRYLKKKVYIKFVDDQMNRSVEYVCHSVGVVNGAVLALYPDQSSEVDEDGVKNFPLCNILQYNVTNVTVIGKDKVESEVG